MDYYRVTGMSCAACQARVEKAVSGVPGVTECAVSLMTNSMSVSGSASPAEVIKAVEKAGYGAALRADSGSGIGPGSGDGRSKAVPGQELFDKTERKKLVKRLVFSAVFLLALMYVTMGHNMLGWPLPPFLVHNHVGLAVLQMLLAGAVMVVNQKFFVSGFRSLFGGSPNMDTLVAMGSSVSFAWSTCVLFRMTALLASGTPNADLMDTYHNLLYFESAAMIPALITVGKLLEAISKGRTANALKELVKLAPRRAIVVRDGIEIEADADTLAPGDIFAVKPGGSIPADGVVLEGISAVDESALTGESVPVEKAANDTVSAATINRSGYLLCRATRVGGDTTLSKIIRMVTDAQATKAPIARIADRISGIFVPLVMVLALITAAGWLIAGASAGDAVERAIAVLVISCPCALGLATPVAIMAGSGKGARSGILFKNGEALETVGRVDTVVLDKTGTVTEGRPRVTDIIAAEGFTEEYLIAMAYSLEDRSEHPLARAIVEKALAMGIEKSEAAGFEAIPGRGIKASVQGKTVAGGSRRYIESVVRGTGHDCGGDPGGNCDRGGGSGLDGSGGSGESRLFEAGEALSGHGKTPLYFAENGALIGLIAAADTIKETSREAVAAFKRMGLGVVMLTGDNEGTAEYIAGQAGIDSVMANVMPDEKANAVKELQRTGRVAMIGDGINDAPALTTADVGIAIGAGTDVAVESAGIVLVNSDLGDAAAAVRLGRGTLRNIRQNLFWAFFYNMICIPLAAGLFVWKMNPMIGAAAMALSSVTVCLNALRLNLLNVRDGTKDKPLRSIFKGRRLTGKGIPSDEADRGKCVTPDEADRGKRVTSDDFCRDKGGAACESGITVKVSGMMCPHCEMAVKSALEALDFVESAAASHEKGEVAVKLKGAADIDAMKRAIEEKGYGFMG